MTDISPPRQAGPLEALIGWIVWLAFFLAFWWVVNWERRLEQRRYEELHPTPVPSDCIPRPACADSAS